ncbi:sulfite exporter TauE/SafE family protein [Methylobacterium mesophilicum SR1.6/6]|uniref:Probable membrane transporter protein n=1 Tax=Methylobacterium mesophilicum SR1.6/6 TaxID=908290 RepID=A0A6B9FNB1_9HYPH|nr:sulfite exporter TauE/SafE family protein [Methylobacterium mesophilicum]QGY03216.1 sulfite exporter TauE/SafE family protein [Methylobacterium mesophilicum SR1.6/6]
MNALPALLSGSGVGFTLGLIGGGGSILATPLLLYVVGMAQPHLAIGTGALAVAANAFLTLIGHARTGNVRWNCAAVFAGIGILGAFVGSTLGKAIDGQRLLFLFALLMVVVGVHMLRGRRGQGGSSEPVGCGPVPSWRVTGVAFTVGVLSGFFGIGGGFLIVPGLVFATGMPLINAVGTSLLAVGAFGLATALNYALSGMVDWVVAGEFIAGGILGGFLGMRLANRLAGYKGVLNTVFAAVIFVVAGYMLYRNASAFAATP